jgi:cell wall-associated NlpC family hydrolase
MEEGGQKKEGGLGKALLVVLAALAAVLMIPVIAVSSIICVLGEKEADYNAKVAKAMFSGGAWPPSLSLETDLYHLKMQVELEDLRKAWIGLHAGDSLWKAADHEEEDLLMRVCFYVRFYKSSRKFDAKDYQAFAKIFDKAETVNDAFEELDFWYGSFGDAQQKAVRDCAFVVTTDAVPPDECDVTPAFGKWKQKANADWHELPGNEDGPEAARLARTRLGDPYDAEKKGVGKYADSSWLVKWCWSQVGVVLPGTAAEQAKYLTEQGRSISPNDLKKGDLIFWSYGPNGRYGNVTHVGICSGDGKVICASWSAGKVVETWLRDEDKIVLCVRPEERE